MPYYRYERGSDEGVADAIVHVIGRFGGDTSAPEQYRDRLTTDLHPLLIDWLLDPGQDGVEPGQTVAFTVVDALVTVNIESRDTLRIRADLSPPHCGHRRLRWAE